MPNAFSYEMLVNYLLVGAALIGEGFDLKIPQGYLYFAMAFSAATTKAV